jgi:integrase
MASLVNEGNGRRRIDFFASNGERRSLRLGECSKADGSTIKGHVAAILFATRHGTQLPNPTAAWLGTLSDTAYGKLVEFQLVKPRKTPESTLLGAFLDKHLAEKKPTLKQESYRKLVNTKDKLLAIIPAGTALRDITPDQASDWRQSLATLGLSEATIKTHTGNAKVFFGDAVRRELLTRNPFEHLTSGCTATRNDRYVTPEESATIIKACPSMNLKLAFALARYAGLRFPSEVRPLKWGHINWEKSRMLVHSPKTERHPGHERRFVPIVPALLSLLETAHLEAAEGEETILTVGSAGRVNVALRAIVERAGIKTWGDFFQTLRRSCEIEWAQRFPQYAVSRWIGHSITVSGKHYANNVPDELFDRVSGAQQKAQHSSEELGRNKGKEQKVNMTETPITIENPSYSHMEAGGFEPPSRGRLMIASTCVDHILSSCPGAFVV